MPAACVRDTRPTGRDDWKPGESCGMFLGMVTIRIPAGMPLVEVTAPDGTKSVWAAAVSPRHAVAAVKQLIPADHVAELLDKRVPSDTVPWVRRGDVRRIE
jgi:hypothetical protein